MPNKPKRKLLPATYQTYSDLKISKNKPEMKMIIFKGTSFFFSSLASVFLRSRSLVLVNISWLFWSSEGFPSAMYCSIDSLFSLIRPLHVLIFSTRPEDGNIYFSYFYVCLFSPSQSLPSPSEAHYEKGLSADCRDWFSPILPLFLQEEIFKQKDHPSLKQASWKWTR